MRQASHLSATIVRLSPLCRCEIPGCHHVVLPGNVVQASPGRLGEHQCQERAEHQSISTSAPSALSDGSARGQSESRWQGVLAATSCDPQVPSAAAEPLAALPGEAELASRHQFWAQAAAVCDLYLNPPAGTVLICIDEKTGIQAKCRKFP